MWIIRLSDVGQVGSRVVDKLLWQPLATGDLIYRQ